MMNQLPFSLKLGPLTTSKQQNANRQTNIIGATTSITTVYYGSTLMTPAAPLVTYIQSFQINTTNDAPLRPHDPTCTQFKHYGPFCMVVTAMCREIRNTQYIMDTVLPGFL
jgi:hypothetical protein